MAQIAAEGQQDIEEVAAISNPAPLGLAGFALTTFVLSTINAGWFPVGATNVVVGLALFYGGLGQFMAGMWEFKTGNTFGATAFTSFGAFWLSFAAIFLPFTGIADALTKANVLNQAVGIYLLAWAIFTALLFIGSLRINLALILVLGFLTLTFLALALGKLLSGADMFTTIGGYLGIITALVAWYTALAGLLSSSPRAIFVLPIGPRA